MTSPQWLYPGSRWWKFDFHTHTPASRDAPWHTNSLVLPCQGWLLQFMAAEMDCVAVTDHNSGAWIDSLKDAYAKMKAQADQGNPPNGFRELTIFPGVEISVSGGCHLLALFDPSATTRTITDLLAKISYNGTDGTSDDVTGDGPEKVVAAILEAKGIPIPAHADAPKGLLELATTDGNKSRMDANTIRGVLDHADLLAVEWVDMNRVAPECVRRTADKLTRILGSDCHNVRNHNPPGSRYTWVKMARPTIDGLRLALLDGNEVSIRRSDGVGFDPFRVPAHIITAIEIEKACYMGNGQPTRLECSPLFNAVVGGRGTGKSTVIHALRLATRRNRELEALGKGNEPNQRFLEFCKQANGRDDTGALRSSTVMRVEWRHEGESLLRLLWRADGQLPVVEEYHNGQWLPSPSQNVNADRFPIRIFSQGQIAALAGDGRQALLSIIDETDNIAPSKQEFEEAKRTFFTQRARLRELDGKLADQPEVERKLAEAEKKLATLAQTNHATVLHAYAQAQHQSRDVKMLFDQLRDGATRVANLPEQIVLEDWPSQHFTAQDSDLLAWRQEMDEEIEKIRIAIRQQAQKLQAVIDARESDDRFKQWQSRAQVAKQAHDTLQQQLKEQGVNDPQAFSRLIQERQRLEMMHKDLQRMQSDRQTLLQQIESQRTLLEKKRQSMTSQRKSFIEQALNDNPYVRIAVVPFGFEGPQIERGLRELLDVTDERFAEDIALYKDGKVSGGMAFGLANMIEADKTSHLNAIKQRLVDVDADFGGRFQNYLKRKLEKPEFFDHILAWFPEDDLRIEYQRGGSWSSISQGSQGQRSAALLAFLLAFGEEPLVLDQPEDDLDNHLIYDLIVRQIRENKLRRQLIVVTHNPNVVINGDAELVHVMEFSGGQCVVQQSGALQERSMRDEVCRVMEGGREAFSKRWKRLGTEA
ncbi:MAG: AAA family ATPase [Magnetococcales bacterium]|nr:AAA family ATPase [Magnetococcales bacterium]